MTRHLYDVTNDDSATTNGKSASGYTESDVFCMLILPLATSVLPPVDFTTGEKHPAVISEASIVLDNEGSTHCCEIHAKCTDVIVHCNEYNMSSRSL